MTESGGQDEPTLEASPVAVESTFAYERYDCTVDDPEALSAATEAARRAIEQGECIVMPTDTVYGIGADAFDPDAVQRLLDAKRRGRDMPPPVLIAEPSLIRALATDVPEQAKDLVERHWPGPLTIIVNRQPSLRMDLGDSEGTVALRVPDHELTREILRGTGPMAVSSANLSGRPAAVTCDEAIAQLGDDVAVYLDGGPVGGADAAPSTIVDFTRSADGQVLRHGALSVAVLRESLPQLEDLVPEVVEAEPVEDPEGTDADQPDPGGDGSEEPVDGELVAVDGGAHEPDDPDGPDGTDDIQVTDAVARDPDEPDPGSEPAPDQDPAAGTRAAETDGVEAELALQLAQRRVGSAEEIRAAIERADAVPAADPEDGRS